MEPEIKPQKKINQLPPIPKTDVILKEKVKLIKNDFGHSAKTSFNTIDSSPTLDKELNYFCECPEQDIEYFCHELSSTCSPHHNLRKF